MGGAIHVAGQRAADVLHDEPQRAPQRGIRHRALPQTIHAAVHTQLRGYRAVHQQPYRHRVGGGLYALQVELRLAHCLRRRDQQRQIIHAAARHHGVNRNALHRRLAEAGRNFGDNCLGLLRGARQHACDALARGWHDGQAVAPAARVKKFDALIQIIGRFNQRCAGK